MLPSLHRLAPTGEFYALPRREAQKRNQDGGDPIYGEPFPANCHHDARSCRPTFRVWVADPQTGNKGTANYRVYFARDLWDWYQRQPTDPIDRQKCWSEDWWALHTKYDPDGSIPDWVGFLPKYDRVQQLATEKSEVMQALANVRVVSFGDNSAATAMYALVDLLLGPDGIDTTTGEVDEAVFDETLAGLLDERAVRTARWLLEADVLDVIARHLRTQPENLGSGAQHKWAPLLLDALLRAVTPREDHPDMTARDAVLNDIIGIPDLVLGLVTQARRNEWMHRWKAYEDEWEVVPLRWLWQCLQRADDNDDAAQQTDLSTDEMLEMLELLLRPRPEEDAWGQNWGYTHRYTSKVFALRIVSFLSKSNWSGVRARLLRRDLLRSVTKYSVLALDADAHVADERFKKQAGNVLRRIQSDSTTMWDLIAEVRFEVTGRSDQGS